jgi:hypothetical protein
MSRERRERKRKGQLQGGQIRFTRSTLQSVVESVARATCVFVLGVWNLATTVSTNASLEYIGSLPFGMEVVHDRCEAPWKLLR